MPGIELAPYGTIQYGVHENLGETEYRNAAAWSSTEGRQFLNPEYTSLHRASSTGGNFIPPSTAVIGRYMHMKCLEKDRLANGAFEVWHGATRQGGFHDRRLELEPFGVELMTTKEFEAGSGAADGILSNSAMRKFLDQRTTSTELSVFSRDENYGLDLKARIDAYNPDGGIMVDLKSTKSAAPEIVNNKIYEFNYHIQFAWYERVAQLSGLEVNKWAIFWAEKKAPFATHITVFSDEAKMHARHELHRLLELLKADTEAEAPSTGWPVWTSVTVPNWVKLKSAA